MHDARDPALGLRADGQYVAVVTQREVAIRQVLGDVPVREVALQTLLKGSRQAPGGSSCVRKDRRSAVADLAVGIDG